ncbi:MAG: PAS domain S-box protein [Nitrosomonadales bacterium]|nr:PAS domain S-box protein [Nitrosomonadales bacterium]
MNDKPNDQNSLRAGIGRDEAGAAIPDSDRFFFALSQASTMGIFRTDVHGNYLYVNEPWCKIAGMKPGEALAGGWARAIHPDDRDRVAKAWYISNHAHLNFVLEYRIKRPDGEVRWVLGQAAAERAADGKVMGYVGTITDITQIKQSEEVRQEALQRLQKIASQVPGVVYQFRLRPDGSACVPYASEAAREIYRLDPEEVREDASGIFTHVHPDDLENLKASILTSARDLTPWQHEYRLKFDDGTVRWLLGNSIPQREADGSTLWHGFITDITTRKRVETEIFAVQSRLKATLEAIPDLLFELGLDGRYYDCHSTHPELLAAPPEELIGKTVRDVLPPEAAGVVMQALHEAYERGSSYGRQIELPLSQGTFWFELSIARKHSLAGQEPRFIVLSRDITGRKRAENALAKSEERARLAISVSNLALWDLDVVTGSVYLSEGWSQLLGGEQQPTFTTVQKLADLVPQEEQQMVRAAILEAVKGHVSSSYQVTHRVKKLDGEYIWVLSEGHVTDRDPNGWALRMVGTNRNITERKLSETELLKSEANLMAALNNSPFLTWLKDSDGRYLKVNKAYADYAKLDDAQQIIGKTDFDLWPKELAEKYRSDDVEVMASRHQKRVEEPSFDGANMHWVETFKTPVIDQSGNVLGTTGFARDITERKQAEQALAESESRFREIFNTVNDAIFIHDAETGRIVDVNNRMCEMYGMTHEEALACGADDLSAGTPPYSSAEAAEKIRLARTGGPQTFDWLARARDGHLFWVEVSLRFARIGNQQRVLAVVRDISDRKHADEEIRIAATVFESQEGMMVTDANSVILRVNQAFTDITGYTAEEAVGQTPSLLKSGRHDEAFFDAMWESIRRTGVWKGEIWNRRKNGEVYPERLSITAVKDCAGEITHYVATLHDITERKQAEEQIHNLAFYDTLTQLPNRRMLSDRMNQAMASSKRSSRYGALLFLDLDNFKPLNDTYGHAVGDLLLKEVARRISSCVREMDTVARFGGDEFVVMLTELDANKVESTAQAGIVAEKIRIILAEPYVLKIQQAGKAETTVEHHCTSSIGVVLFINHEDSPEDIIKWADMAMYQAKDDGRNLIRFHDPKG